MAKILKTSRRSHKAATHRHRGHVSVRTQSALRLQADARARRVMPLIRAIRKSGVSTLRGIAEALNRKRVATARGGRWHPSTVRSVLLRA